MVLGLDGIQKMGKSYNNQIELAATAQETQQRVMTAVTDPARRYRTDPGHPEVCNVFRLHHFFNPERVEKIAVQCRSASIGCVECKSLLAQEINSTLAVFRERRAVLAAKPEYVMEILTDGACRAQMIARETLEEVKEKMGLLKRALTGHVCD